MSHVGGGDGSLRLDFPFVAGPAEAPGGPLTITLHYSSAFDDPGTYGTQIGLRIRVEDKSDPACSAQPSAYLPEAVDAAHITFGHITGSPMVGFGLVQGWLDSGLSIACNATRDAPIPIPWSSRSRHTPFSPDECSAEADHGCAPEREASVLLPLKVRDESNGPQPSFQAVTPADGCQTATGTVAFSGNAREIHAVKSGAGLTFPLLTSGPGRYDFYPDCKQYLLLEKWPDEGIARMGRNWTHSLAARVTPMTATDGAEFLVLVLPTGGRVSFKVPAVQFPTMEYPRYPEDAGTCSCTSRSLFRTSRPHALPQITAPFYAWEYVDTDGSRMVFAAQDVYENDPSGTWVIVPQGRLVRTEQDYGRNPVALTYYLNGDLDEIHDALGNVTRFNYTGSGVDTRLSSIWLPGLRFVTLTWTGGKLTEIRDPLQAVAMIPGHQFSYGTGTNDAESITCRTLPDGEAHRYTYITDPIAENAGHLSRAELVSDCGSTPTVLSALSYSYAGPTTPDGTRWVRLTPQDPTSEPTRQWDSTADGRVLREHEICAENYGDAVARACPIVPEVSPYRIVDMVTAYAYDEFDQRRSVRRYPVVIDPAGTKISLEASHFTASCVVRDTVSGRPTEVLGPTCIDESQQLLDGWSDAACDCEAYTLPRGAAPGPTPVGARVQWDLPVVAGAPPDGPSVSATVYRPRRIIDPAQRPEYGNPLASNKGSHIFYYAPPGVNPPDPARPADMISDICPPDFDGDDPMSPPPPGTGCEHFEYRTVSSMLGGTISQIARRTDGLGAVWTYGYDPATNLLDSITSPDVSGSSFTTTIQRDWVGDVKLVTAPGGRTVEVWRNLRGDIIRRSQPGATNAERLDTYFTYTPGGRLRRIVDASRPTGEPGKYMSWWLQHADSDPLATAANAARLPAVLRRGSSTLPLTNDVLDADTLYPDEALGERYATWRYDASLRVRATEWGPTPTASRALSVDARDGFGMPLAVRLVSGSPTLPDDEFVPEQHWCLQNDPRLGGPRAVGFDMPIFGPGGTCDPDTSAGADYVSFDRAGRVTSSESVRRTATAELRHVSCSERDNWGRLTAQHDDVQTVSGGCLGPQAFRSVGFTYDLASRPTLVSYSDNGALYAKYALGYDTLSRLRSWRDILTGDGMDFERRADGLLNRMDTVRPGRFGEDRWLRGLIHDNRGFVESVTAAELNGSLDHWEYSYQHDDAGRVTWARRALIGNALPGSPPPPPLAVTFQKAYEYSPDNPWNLRRITDELSSQVTTLDVDAGDRLQNVPPPAPRTYQYHSHVGALKSVTIGAGPTRRYRWDSAGRMHAALTETTGGALEGFAYAYDPSNRLIVRQAVTAASASAPLLPAAGSEPVLHLWDGWQQVGEWTPSQGEPDLAWTAGPAGVTGVRLDGAVGQQALFHDHQGSVKTGPADEGVVYDAFGNVVEGALDIPRGFQDQEWRAESDLYYMRNRWYDPKSARFLSRDPVVQDDLANYAFVRNSPVMLADPMGLLPEGMERYLRGVHDSTPGSISDKRRATTMAAWRLLRKCLPRTGRNEFLVGGPIGGVEPSLEYSSFNRVDAWARFDPNSMTITIYDSIWARGRDAEFTLSGGVIDVAAGPSTGITVPPESVVSELDHLVMALLHERAHFAFPRVEHTVGPYLPPVQMPDAIYEAAQDGLQSLWSNPDCTCP